MVRTCDGWYQSLGRKGATSDLVDRAASGVEVTILRRGKAVARIVGIERPRKPLNVGALREHTSRMRPSEVTGVEILREMRDSRF